MLKVIKKMAEFDFYTVSIDQDYESLLSRIAQDLDLDIEKGYPKFGYEKCVNLVRGSTTHMIMQWGGAAIGSFVAYNLVTNDGLSSLSEQSPVGALAVAQPARPAATTNIYSWSSAPVATSVAGCIANHDRSRCQCYDDDGKTLTLEHAQCLSILNNPLPRSVRVNQSKQS